MLYVPLNIYFVGVSGLRAGPGTSGLPEAIRFSRRSISLALLALLTLFNILPGVLCGGGSGSTTSVQLESL